MSGQDSKEQAVRPIDAPLSEVEKGYLERHHRAAHAVQTGVKYAMQFDDGETQPKHLRVGVNMAMVEHAALAEVLINHGIITREEYFAQLAEVMEREQKSYEEKLKRLTGAEVSLA